jgi:MFS family permease
MAACAAAGVAVLAAFTAVERRVKAPLLDLAIFRSRVFTGSVLAALTLYVTLFTVVLLLPFYFVEGRGLEPSQAGALLCAQPVGMALVSAPAGNLSDRLGTRLFCVTGAGIVGVGVLLLSWAGPATPLVWTVLGLAVIGIGTGVFTSPNSSAMMGAAPRGGQGVAGGVLAVSRNLGMMLGTAMAAGLYVAAGGATGRHWQAEDYSAFHITGLAALLPCLLAMLSSTLKGNAEKKGSA